MTTPDEDVAEAEAAAGRALGVCLYKAGCGAHQRFDSVTEAEAWGKAHTQAHPGHRTQVWSARIDDLAVVNPILQAITSYVADCNERIAAEADAILNDPDWGKAWVSPVFYEAVRARAEAPDASPDMRRILDRIRTMTPMEASPDERSDPRDQPYPIEHRRRRKSPRARH